MRALEPREEYAGEILFKELEDVNEVLFFNKGMYEIGYEFNGEPRFKIRYKNSNLIGAFNVTFNKKSQFIYRTVTLCSGFFIRRRGWVDLTDCHDMVSEELR